MITGVTSVNLSRIPGPLSSPDGGVGPAFHLCFQLRRLYWDLKRDEQGTVTFDCECCSVFAPVSFQLPLSEAISPNRCRDNLYQGLPPVSADIVPCLHTLVDEIACYAAQSALGQMFDGSSLGMLVVAEADISSIPSHPPPPVVPEQLYYNISDYYSHLHDDEVYDLDYDYESGDEDFVGGGGGASSEVVAWLKKERVVAVNEEVMGGCVVCLEEYSAKEVVINLPCSHVFHESCICTWLEKKSSCPVCRREVAAC